MTDEELNTTIFEIAKREFGASDKSGVLPMNSSSMKIAYFAPREYWPRYDTVTPQKFILGDGTVIRVGYSKATDMIVYRLCEAVS